MRSVLHAGAWRPSVTRDEHRGCVVTTVSGDPTVRGEAHYHSGFMSAAAGLATPAICADPIRSTAP